MKEGEMDALIQDLESRTEYVITLQREEAEPMDQPPGSNAFAFVLGLHDGPAIVVEGSVSGDGKESIVTVWPLGGEMTTLELDGTVQHTLRLAT